MQELGKTLVIIGILVALFGAVLWSGIGKSWIGRLPGDLYWSKGSFSFSFPIVTCLLLSVMLTIIFSFFRK